jgi:hypothetical protein
MAWGTSSTATEYDEADAEGRGVAFADRERAINRLYYEWIVPCTFVEREREIY